MLAKEKGWTRDLAGAVGSRARDMRQHGLSDTAFRKRAKANGWIRDLSSASCGAGFAKVWFILERSLDLNLSSRLVPRTSTASAAWTST